MYIVNKPHPAIYEAFMATEGLFGASQEDLISKNRHEPLASVRALFCCILHIEMWVSVSHCATAVHRSRESITYYLAKHPDRMETDKEYRESYEALKTKVEIKQWI